MTLKGYRLQSGMTQKDLERASGVSIRTIRKIENHNRLLGNITVNTAIRLTRALGITFEELIGKVFDIDDKMYFENDFIWFEHKEAGE